MDFQESMDKGGSQSDEKTQIEAWIRKCQAEIQHSELKSVKITPKVATQIAKSEVEAPKTKEPE